MQVGEGGSVRFNLTTNMPDVIRQIEAIGPKGKSVLRESMNRAGEWAQTDVTREMRKVFDRPVAFTLRSLRLYHASTTSMRVTLWFRQRTADADKPWAMPQIRGGERTMKPMELRLQRMGLLPLGWMVVPGAAAPMDAFGNMSRGEISRILNVLGTFTEGGYNKANAKTKERLRNGNAKKGVYGFEYFVNPATGPGRQQHLLPGLYRRVYTRFGTSLKPMMVFVNGARYRARLDFFGIVRATMNRRIPSEFDKAMRSLLETGSASGLRRGRVA